MKFVCNIIVLCFLAGAAFAESEVASTLPKVDELTSAYQREILFLSTYKRELQSKIKTVQSSLGGKVREGKNQLDAMEKKWLTMQTDNEVLIQKLNEIERDYENKKENRDLLQTTLKQAQMSRVNTAENAVEDNKTLLAQITDVYAQASVDLRKSTTVTKQEGTYYRKNGEEEKGEILSLGTIAKFVSHNGDIAALYPSGSGTFRVWDWLDSESSLLSEGKIPQTLSLFIFDNPDKEFMAQKEKTTMDVIRSGGLIGWIIIIMGLFAAFISGLRFLMLQKAQNQKGLSIESVLEKVAMGEVDQAQKMLLQKDTSVSRVLNKTLSFLKTEPAKVEDAINEAIIKESQLVDRFGVVILVIASVAPLMGLLGTVTGMISTFDIITMYGTGNPKLLSGGISEALVTTMFGLIVAIPALLIGQFLSSKTENIKSDMEKYALATCNAFDNQKGKSV